MAKRKSIETARVHHAGRQRGGCLADSARAQLKHRISILHSGYPNRTPIQHLFTALRALGYEDGQTAAIELLGGEGDPDRLNTLVAKLAAETPDVTIALTEPAVLALRKADVRTPVVFAFVSDPVGRGIVNSLAHPGKFHWHQL